MYKLLCSILLFVSLNAFAEVNKDFSAPCYPLNMVMRAIGEYKETPAIVGYSQRTEGNKEMTNMMLIFLNTQTQTWTMVEKIPNGLYCLIAAGTNFDVIPKNKPL